MGGGKRRGLIRMGKENCILYLVSGIKYKKMELLNCWETRINTNEKQEKKSKFKSQKYKLKFKSRTKNF